MKYKNIKIIGLGSSLLFHTLFLTAGAIYPYFSKKTNAIQITYIQSYTNYKPLELEFSLSLNQEQKLQNPDFEMPQIKITLEKEVLKMEKPSDEEKLSALEKSLKIAEDFPEEHVQEIIAKIKQTHNLQKREYTPKQEITINDLDTNSVVPYYRIIKVNKKDYFQEILVDKNGNYIINKEKPTSKMTVLERIRYAAFQMADEKYRNLALGIIDNR